MRTTSVDVIRIPTKGPGDVSGLIGLIEAGKIDPKSILAILGKTEGNGGVNDFTREYAVAALCAALAPHLGLSPHQVEQRIAFVMSGGTEGVLSPHITVFARTATADGAPIEGKRLSLGIAQTRDFLPEELGRARADRGDRQRRSRRHGRCRHRRSRRRAFRADQMSPADQRPHRGRPRQGTEDRHHQRLWLDGLFARRLGARRGRGARRDRRRTSATQRSSRTGICSPRWPRPRPGSS